MKKTCSFIILNYNGADLLKRCLPSVLNAAQEYGSDNEVVVLDNGSIDESEEIVKKHFPSVKWIKASANRFLISYNEYLTKCTHTHVFILNNDIILRTGCLNKLMPHFEDSNVFSVAPFVVNPGDKPENGRSKLYWSGCRFKYKIVDFNFGLTSLVSTAAGLYDREKLVSMGGFDEMLFPMYGEEIDLTLRAYRRGWIVLFEPQAIVDHIGGATINRKVRKTNRRASLVKNRHLLMVKHVHSNLKLLCYAVLSLLLLPIRIIFLDSGYLTGTINAVKQWKIAFNRRKTEERCSIIDNNDLFKKLEQL